MREDSDLESSTSSDVTFLPSMLREVMLREVFHYHLGSTINKKLNILLNEEKEEIIESELLLHIKPATDWMMTRHCWLPIDSLYRRRPTTQITSVQ
jgi:hypothetical protein